MARVFKPAGTDSFFGPQTKIMQLFSYFSYLHFHFVVEYRDIKKLFNTGYAKS